MTIRKTSGMVVLSSFNEMIDEWTTEITAPIRRTFVHTYIRTMCAVSSEELAECLTSKEPTEDEGVGVTVRVGGRKLCHTYCITHDIH